jgi:hypothetical protein
MIEPPVEKVIREDDFGPLLQTGSAPFFGLVHALLAAGSREWRKLHYHQLRHDANSLESFLDDYGARYNQTFHFFTELVAGIRGLATAAYSLSHLAGRLGSYGAPDWLPQALFDATVLRLDRAGAFLNDGIERMLLEARLEADRLGASPSGEYQEERGWLKVAPQNKLPRDLGQDKLQDEAQRIAEVASKYIQAVDLVQSIDPRELDDPKARTRFLRKCCTEEQARVYEATIHNLQSTYDTHIKNTVLEAKDPRLEQLRGHASCALHLFEAITDLIHFQERHESEEREAIEETSRRMRSLVSPAELEEIVLNHLLVGAAELLENGRGVVEDLLPSYTNLQELECELLDGVSLHARPAALIVKIVHHHGTPVEMEVAGSTCNAGSILELLVAVGSNPDTRSYIFRGDERPLRHIGLLFERALGEGPDALPEELDYLRI